MPGRKTILAVDDDGVNRRILAKILADEYEVLTAENGVEALALLEEQPTGVAAIILDVIMPEMDGFSFLRHVQTQEKYRDIPVIVSTGNDGREQELRALECGAWDFVSKPYDGKILKFRLRNAIARSQLTVFEQMKYLAEYDTLTQIFNKAKFFSATRAMLRDTQEHAFAFVRFDIDRFQLINAFYGTQEGDRMLQVMARELEELVTHFSSGTYGRIEGDVFACCVAYGSQKLLRQELDALKQKLKAYKSEFDVNPVFGVYYLSDLSLPMEVMLDRAALAAKSCKGNYMNSVGIYVPDMSRRLEQEQAVVNEMDAALRTGQFTVYYQPKYSLQTNAPYGAEALVRWVHPEKGIISPSAFIPIFERNGFIAKLDYFVWETVCQTLQRWLQEGRSLSPVSVNVSRVNLYNPHFVEKICALTTRYQVPPVLLQLELTESAYMDSPDIMKRVVCALHKKGFSILMDDFGTGYSSLSILKDVEVDGLKIDLHFLEHAEIPGRGENILASIVRMAKWLNVPAIAEGVERTEQVDFLRSVGCEYAQGYYFAKPMPQPDYEELLTKGAAVEEPRENSFDANGVWGPDSQMEALFTNGTQASCVYEYCKDRVEILRFNQAFRELCGAKPVNTSHAAWEYVEPEYRDTVLAAFRRAVAEQGVSICEYQRRVSPTKTVWVSLKLEYINRVDDRVMLFGSLYDITVQKSVEAELKKYQGAMMMARPTTNRMLVVDDSAVEREMLRGIFGSRFTVLEAENGASALEVLEAQDNRVDVILLDLMMPVMDGLAFLQYRQAHDSIAHIPVIMMTADDAPEQQIQTMAMGASEYLHKPFVAEIALRRVENVLEATNRMREILQEYETVKEAAQTDPLTRLYNRTVAERKIDATLAVQAGRMHGLVMIDLDNFKGINDGYGHHNGDQILVEFARLLQSFFRQTDIIARFGGDEFCVFLVNVRSAEIALRKCQELCCRVRELELGEEHQHISCSVGVAVTSAEACTFETLYKNADLALYRSKREGKNLASLYEKGTR